MNIPRITSFHRAATGVARRGARIPGLEVRGARRRPQSQALS
ncbi:hypothetical protein WG902_17090 [Ramlibacter sp. PS3R-8]